MAKAQSHHCLCVFIRMLLLILSSVLSRCLPICAGKFDEDLAKMQKQQRTNFGVNGA